MNQGKYVFIQIMSFVDHNDFLACVKRYKGDHKVKDFTIVLMLIYKGLWKYRLLGIWEGFRVQTIWAVFSDFCYKMRP